MADALAAPAFVGETERSAKRDAALVVAIVGEGFAGPDPPDADSVSIRKAPDDRALERAMAKATNNWAKLEASPDESIAVAAARARHAAGTRAPVAGTRRRARVRGRFPATPASRRSRRVVSCGRGKLDPSSRAGRRSNPLGSTRSSSGRSSLDASRADVFHPMPTGAGVGRFVGHAGRLCTHVGRSAGNAEANIGPDLHARRVAMYRSRLGREEMGAYFQNERAG